MFRNFPLVHLSIFVTDVEGRVLFSSLFCLLLFYSNAYEQDIISGGVNVDYPHVHERCFLHFLRATAIYMYTQ